MWLTPTKNDLAENVRSKVVELLNSRLADCIDLRTQTTQAHWNVKGPEFVALHQLFDAINGDVEEYGDTFAERAGAIVTPGENLKTFVVTGIPHRRVRGTARV